MVTCSMTPIPDVLLQLKENNDWRPSPFNYRDSLKGSPEPLNAHPSESVSELLLQKLLYN